MKRISKPVCLLSAVLLTAGLAGCAESEELSVSISNSLGYDLSELYVSPAGEGDWGDKRLAKILQSGGGAVGVQLDEYLEHSYFDLRAVDTEGDSYYFYELPLNDGSSVEISVSAEGEPAAVVQNSGAFAAATVPGSFESATDVAQTAPSIHEHDVEHLDNGDGSFSFKDYTLGVMLTYPSADITVTSGLLDDAVAVTDGGECFVVSRDVTDEYWDFPDPDDDVYLERYIKSYLFDDFESLLGDGSALNDSVVKAINVEKASRMATADVDIFNNSHDMTVRVALETRVYDSDGSSRIMAAAYFSPYDDSQAAGSIRRVTFNSVRRT